MMELARFRYSDDLVHRVSLCTGHGKHARGVPDFYGTPFFQASPLGASPERWFLTWSRGHSCSPSIRGWDSVISCAAVSTRLFRVRYGLLRPHRAGSYPQTMDLCRMLASAWVDSVEDSVFRRSIPASAVWIQVPVVVTGSRKPI